VCFEFLRDALDIWDINCAERISSLSGPKVVIVRRKKKKKSAILWDILPFSLAEVHGSQRVCEETNQQEAEGQCVLSIVGEILP
jgi:hypothetical protein